MNVYRFELKSLLKGTLGWCAALCAMMSVYLMMYPMFRDTGFDANELFSKFPATLQSLFGMTGINTKLFVGFLPFPLKLAEEAAAIGGLVLGVHAAAHDSRQKCADFLFSKPVSRERLLWAKVLAMLTSGGMLYAALAVFLPLTAGLFAPGEPFPLGAALACAAVPVLIFLLYAAAGMLLGVVYPKVKGAAAIGVGSMFFFHIVFSIGKVLTKDPDNPIVRAAVPVCMFDRSLAAQRGRLEWPFLLLWCCEIAVLLAFSFAVLRRRDIE